MYSCKRTVCTARVQCTFEGTFGSTFESTFESTKVRRVYEGTESTFEGLIILHRVSPPVRVRVVYFHAAAD